MGLLQPLESEVAKEFTEELNKESLTKETIDKCKEMAVEIKWGHTNNYNNTVINNMIEDKRRIYNESKRKNIRTNN